MASSLLTNILKIMAITFILFALFWLGTCAYGNTIGKTPTAERIPRIQDARDMLVVKSSGYVLYLGDYTVDYADGQAVYATSDFWEVTAKGYVHRTYELTIDERTFGPVEIRRRGKDE